jgi:hypothetical protein
MDLPLGGGAFTRSISHDLPVWSRVDRFLISPEWEELFLVVSQRRLPNLCLDHFPILLDCGDALRGE